ncbi:monovalent cation/H+ antiporter subunit D family protein [Pseudomaricurvus alcaniphilus]|uniref:proton-conducting transporter transmembrane domain-containing protein n=1 Tax=Pseudomaricurvus alcaniphilus TaxID=1166482 RepID=UPI00140781E5|nr:proton-conducting transporter membrane subunit [Pseudomaricurvus alcaniphilus]NHN36494.1 monovalent cation/H+ antiporter subunit D family protein [Pseudomaricurvus alcaniphilus]
MSLGLLLHATIVLPLLALVGILLLRDRPNLRDGVSLVAGVLVFACVATIYQRFTAGERIELTWFEILPGLSLSFSLEALGLLFALVAGFLWPVTTLYAIGYMRGHGEANQTRFYLFFALAMAAVFAIAFSANLFTLFIFYEVLTLSTYPLVTHAGTEKARKGGRVYLGMLLGSSILLLLLAIIATWTLAGTLTFTAGGIFPDDTPAWVLSVLLALFVFGIGKAAIMPVHRWLPAAMVAPTPVSALLHAVAVVKAGVFTLLKVCVFVFGVDTLPTLPVTQWLIYLAGLTIVLASLVALYKDNLKARLAYSTVAQLAYVTLGALVATELAIAGSALHIAMHAFGKITLFFCAGAIMVACHKTEVSQMQGLGRVMPVTMTAFLVASLSIIGLPPAGGTWSKWLLIGGSLEADQQLMVAVLITSSLLNIAYLLPIPLRAFFGSASDDGHGPERSVREAPLPALIALVITAVMCVGLFAFPNAVFDLAQRIYG